MDTVLNETKDFAEEIAQKAVEELEEFLNEQEQIQKDKYIPRLRRIGLALAGLTKKYVNGKTDTKSFKLEQKVVKTQLLWLVAEEDVQGRKRLKEKIDGIIDFGIDGAKKIIDIAL